MYNQYSLITNQRGAATLVTALILLLAITLVTFTAARTGVTEHRASANDMHAKEAFEVAQAGIEQGIAYLTANMALINSTQAANTTPPRYDGWMRAGAVRWIACGATEYSVPCGDGVNAGSARGVDWRKYNTANYPLANQFIQPTNKYTYTLDLLAQNDPATTPDPENNPVIYITASVTSTDPLAGLNANNPFRVTQIVKGVSALANVAAAPLMVAGTLPTSGNISIWGNPNPPAVFYDATKTTDPLGAGKPLSAWGEDVVTVDGSAQTCVPLDPPSSNSCSKLSRDKPANLNGANALPPGCVDDSANDIRDCFDYASDVPFPSPAGNATSPPYFPEDVFYFTFGVPDSQYLQVKSNMTVLADCSTLPNQPTGWYWITGNCNLPSNNVGGTNTALTGAVNIVVEGDLTFNGNTHYWGLIYMRGAGTVQLNGTATLHGALISDHSISMANGTFDAVYDASALGTGFPTLGRFAKVAGAWIDQAQ